MAQWKEAKALNASIIMPAPWPEESFMISLARAMKEEVDQLLEAHRLSLSP